MKTGNKEVNKKIIKKNKNEEELKINNSKWKRGRIKKM